MNRLKEFIRNLIQNFIKFCRELGEEFIDVYFCIGHRKDDTDIIHDRFLKELSSAHEMILDVVKEMRNEYLDIPPGQRPCEECASDTDGA